MTDKHTSDWASAWRQGRPREAALAARAAHTSATTLPDRLDALAGLIGTGESALAHDVLDTLRKENLPAEATTALAMHAHQLGEQEKGLELCHSAAAQSHRTPRQDYLHGTLAMFCGKPEEAEQALEHCLRAAPHHAGAHWTLAQLRRWSRQRHHLERLQAALAVQSTDSADAAYLWFALFKELDDLGHPQAWTALVRGCIAKRKELVFDGEAESRLVDSLIRAFPRIRHGELLADRGVTEGASPIFIVGMPRSGTTLLERILGGHPRITACGELPDFPKQLQWSCDHIGSSTPDATMAVMADQIDSSGLGQRYLAQTRWRAAGRPFYLDKLPRNFWNIGFIAAALPHAPILHMVRNPMDTCFSNLKELFGNAYAYSYNLAELAEHHGRYRRLMAHWHAVLPGRILDVQYEDLVRDPEAVARRVLSHCGLDWDPACLMLDERTDAVATASTTQVRAPIHQRSIGGWRRYEQQLAPLRQLLQGQ